MFTGTGTDHQILQCPPMPLPTMDRKWKSTVELAPNCPRCASSNTKFCYYNNYSLSQPRYFCKGCRRYWTKGGSLRNVPVGGGCRKNRRAKSASRLSQNNEGVSVNYSKSFSGFDDKVNEQTAKACCSDGDSVVQANGSDIDMALVFAKFLNESSSNSDNPEELVCQDLDNVSNSLTADSVQNDAMIDCQKPTDDQILEEFNQILAGDKQQECEKEDHQRVQDFLESDMNNAAFELQTLLDDEVVQDLSWANQAASTLPNFTWQSVFQLQEFDSFPATDHQLMTSANNLISDNWGSSFDFSAGFEVYSRHY